MTSPTASFIRTSGWWWASAWRIRSSSTRPTRCWSPGAARRSACAKRVEQLKAEGRGEHKTHRLVHRPWGTYEDIDQGERFRVKHITVEPGGKLSLQYHHHRAEHWIIVSGTARVTKGSDVSLLTENQSIYINLGEMHRLENPGKVPLQLIEVQTGGYLGEDDIVRVEDVYQRATGD